MTRTRLARRALGRFGLYSTFAFSMAFAPTAHAEFDPGWYIGGGAGLYTFTEVTSTVPSQLRGESAVGQQIFGGYQLKFIALEAGYWYFNKLSGTSGGIEDRFQMDGWFGRGMLMLPFEYSPSTSIAIFGGGGAQNWKVDTESRDKTAGTIISKNSFSQDGTSIIGGIWIRGQHASTRLEYEVFSIKDSDDEIGIWTINFVYNF